MLRHLTIPNAMRRTLSVCLIGMGLMGSGIALWAVQRKPPPTPYQSIQLTDNPDYVGEYIQYRIAFGVFNIGTGTTKVDTKLHTVQSKKCYKVMATGKTSGLLSWIAKINDRFGAYIDTATLLTHVASRKLREGNFRMDEISVFDHDDNTVSVKEKNQKTGKFKPPKVYAIPNNARDLISAFLYIRTFDFNKMNRGDTASFPVFLEDTVYDFKTLHMGTEKIKTDLGWMRCIKLVPIMPENKIFDGENSISCWFSDDKNRIPVKLQAKMFVGNFRVDITGFKGLKNPLEIIF